ncbi:MAG: hypothetical protein AAGI53_13680 [Planctomycetota bacterium]
MILRAFAKVNLCLSVGEAIREGVHRGMHPIASWMVPLDLCDEVEIAPASQRTVDVRWADGTPVAWDIERDLATRAAKLLDDRLGSRGYQISVRKRIPAGGGLGGGSSDAAAVLLGLDELFGLGIAREELRSRSAELGSDIAFFIDDVAVGEPPRPAIVEGLGDRVERTALLSGDLTLVCPEFGCPTGEVYRAFDDIGAGRLRAAEVRATAHTGDLRDDVLFNDLAGPAERVAPELSGVRARVAAESGRPAHVSGSGSTVFVLGWHESDVNVGTVYRTSIAR